MKVNFMIKYTKKRNLEKNENKMFYSTSRPFTITSGTFFQMMLMKFLKILIILLIQQLQWDQNGFLKR